MSVLDIQKRLIEDDLLSAVGSLLRDPDVSEIMINGPFEIFAERGGRIEKTACSFGDEFELEAVARSILQFVGKRLPPTDASLEARLPDGSRVHIVRFLTPTQPHKYISISIRKFKADTMQLSELVAKGSLPEGEAEWLMACVRAKKNVIVSGGTGTGKTTMLNCLSEGFGETERIIVIEDAAELKIRRDHVVQLEVRPPDRHGRGGLSVRDLFKASLRMRPDRVIVGECRGGEAFDMIQAMSSGHAGSLSTVHADTPAGALNRLETLSMMADTNMPLLALRRQIVAAIDVIVQLTRREDGRRLVTSISSADTLDDKENYVLTQRYVAPS